MCHLTKKHKDRTLGSQSRALEVCGVVYDPNAPLPPVRTVQRASTEESRLESNQADGDGYPQEMEYSTASDEEEDQDTYAVKTEATENPEQQTRIEESTPALPPAAPSNTNGSTKQSISSIIDNPESTAPPPSSSETPASASQEQTTPVKEKVEPTEPSPDREPSETKEAEVKTEAK